MYSLLHRIRHLLSRPNFLIFISNSNSNSNPVQSIPYPASPSRTPYSTCHIVNPRRLPDAPCLAVQ